MKEQIRKILFIGLANDGSLCTFHWNDTFLSFCDLYGKTYPIKKAQKKMRYYITTLIKEGYVLPHAKRAGLGAGGYTEYGVRSYTTYMVNLDKMAEIKEWLYKHSVKSRY